MDDSQKEQLQEILNHANNIINILMSYEPNRPGSIALNKIEECIMWSQVMVANAKKRVKEGELVDSNIILDAKTCSA